jgi:DNA-directed RNA polymerase specialized sigma24 family protein
VLRYRNTSPSSGGRTGSAAEEEPRVTEVIHLRFFAGMTVEETAKLLDVHPKTVKRDWAFARACLNHELKLP